MSKFRGIKTNNAKTTAKPGLRKDLMACFDSASVLEVYCGEGEMYREVWRAADKYTGIDKKKFFDERHTICGDAIKALRLVDITEYNIFDIDAYGSPYSALYEIVNNVGKHEKIGFVLTDGTNMDLKMGRISKYMRYFTGIDSHIVKRSNLIHDELISDVISKVAEILGGKIEKKRIAKGKTGSSMRYYSFIISRETA